MFYHFIQVDEEQIKKIIVWITGDGAFAKGNNPFKSTITKLIRKQITIRWDLLHMINRAQEEADIHLYYM